MKLIILVMRWLALITSLVSLILLTMFLMDGERFNPRPKQLVGMAFFPLGVAVGLIVAWWKEGIGAAIALISLACFYTIYGWLMGGNVNTLWFVVFASPAFLFLTAWALSRSNRSEVNLKS